MSYEPITLTYSDGSTIRLSRENDIVTAEGHAVNPQTISQPKPLPPQFAPRGNVYGLMVSSTEVYTEGSWYIQIAEVTPFTLGIVPGSAAPGPYNDFSTQWLADPEVPPAPPAPAAFTPRVWLYQKLSSTPEIANLVGGLTDTRVFAKKSMTSAIEQHPYIVYKLGYNATEDISEETSPDRQFVQIFVHDYSDGDTGDYGKIDQIIDAMKRVLHLQSSKDYGVIACRYLETSQDLNDETLNTVFKYVRFQLITNGV